MSDRKLVVEFNIDLDTDDYQMKFKNLKTDEKKFMSDWKVIKEILLDIIENAYKDIEKNGIEMRDTNEILN